MTPYDLTKWPHEKPAVPVSVVAIGGFPITDLQDGWQESLKRGFGQGAILTFGNPKRRSLEGFADLCSEKEHFWWLGGLSITWLVIADPVVELEISRSSVAHLSWEEKGNGGTFLACFDLRNARKYFKHRDDASFKPEVRHVLSLMYNDLIEICTFIGKELK